MKTSFPFVVAIACAAGALQALAAMPADRPIPGAAAEPSAQQQLPGAEQQFTAGPSNGVRTGDWEYATPQMIPLDPQPVRSWGAAMQTGARNAHVSPPHGALVTAGDRSSVPGRE
jgi:hypothetical protein